jgi:excisionase family DNA binding protein
MPKTRRHTMTTSDDTRWLTISETAEQYNVSPYVIRRCIADGSLRARRVGPRLIRVDASSLADLGQPVAKI